MSRTPAVVLYDAAGKPLAVKDGETLQGDTPHVILGGLHKTDGKSYRTRVIDDTDTAALKRILVEAAIKPGSSISLEPSASINQIVRGFCEESGGSKEMNVDGSTPVIFSYDANGTKDIFLTEVRFVFNCNSIVMKNEDFGSDGALSNGVKFEVISDGVTTELANLKINEDFLALPSNGGVDLVYDGPSNDQLVVSISFGGTTPLVAGSGDKVKITVRDDIRSSSAHKVVLFWAAVTGVKES